MPTQIFFSEGFKRSFKRLHPKENGVTVSQWIKNALEETLEDAMDLLIAKNAMEDYERNPISYSLDEVISMQKGKPADTKK